jgi:hypothetical protein
LISSTGVATINKHIWQISIRALMFGFIAAAIISSVMTYLDWRQNPAGLFRDTHKTDWTGLFRDTHETDWTIVAETALSWFAPALIVLAILAVPATYWLSRYTRLREVTHNEQDERISPPHPGSGDQ